MDMINKKEEISNAKQFLKTLNVDSEDTDDDRNWEVNDGGIPVFDNLDNVGDVKNRINSYTNDKVNRTIERNMEVLEKLPKAKIHHDIFYDVLDNLLNWDLGIGTAIDRLSMELNQKNLPNINSPAFNSFEKTKNKIEQVMLLQGLIRASGLILYENEIMSEYIKTVFTDKNDMYAILNKYTKEK